MKNFIFGFLALLISSSSFAAGTISIANTYTYDYSLGGPIKRVRKVKVSWVADASAATVPNLSIPLHGYLIKVVTNPGSTAPTANYDIALGDPDDSSLDAVGGLLANRHTSTTEQVYTLVSGAATPIFLSGTYTLSISNNAVNSATGDIYFYLVDQF